MNSKNVCRSALASSALLKTWNGLSNKINFLNLTKCSLGAYAVRIYFSWQIIIINRLQSQKYRPAVTLLVYFMYSFCTPPSFRNSWECRYLKFTNSLWNLNPMGYKKNPFFTYSLILMPFMNICNAIWFNKQMYTF